MTTMRHTRTTITPGQPDTQHVDQTSFAASGAAPPTFRIHAVLVGILYITGTIAGVAGGLLVNGLFDRPDMLQQVAAHTGQVRWAALAMLLMCVSLAMVPAILFPLLRRLNEPLAVGYVVFRGALESFTYLAMAITWLLLVSTAQARTTTGTTTGLDAVGAVLVQAQDPVIVAVQDTVFGLGALMLYAMLYRGRLIPRWLSGWGFLGAALYFAAGPVAAFGTAPVLVLMPLAAQEMVMAAWLIAKGFDTGAIARLEPGERIETAAWLGGAVGRRSRVDSE